MRYLLMPVMFCLGWLFAGRRARQQKRARKEHLWAEFDGEICCQFCYRKQTEQNRHEQCRSNTFYFDDSPWRWS